MKHLTDSKVKSELNQLTLICDTREQCNHHVTDFLDKNGIQYTNRKLDVGDYACMLGDETYERTFVVERKGCLDELAANISERNRLEAEFIRAKAFGIKVYLLIEDATIDDIILHNYSSRLDPKSFMATLMSWQSRYNINTIFCKKENSPGIIYKILYYSVRGELLYGY